MSPIGDIIGPMLERAKHLAKFQDVLNGMTPAAQKKAIIEAHCMGLLEHDDTALLIQVYQLETA